MTLKRRNSGSWADVSTLKRRHSSAWQPIDWIKRRGGGVWNIVFRSINISDQYIAWAAVANTNTGYRLNTSGIAERRTGASYSTLETWLSGSGTSSNYEARVTVQSGATPTGTVGSWVALSSSQEWVIASTSGVLTSNILVEIRNAATLAVIDTASVTLESERL